MTLEYRGPLAGVRVMDMTTAWAGPFAGRVLAYLGAEVIHIESATRLDLWRGAGHGLDPVRYPDLDQLPWHRVCAFLDTEIGEQIKRMLACRVGASAGEYLGDRDVFPRG